MRALEAVPCDVVVADLEGRIVHANTRSLESLGYTREELLGQHVQVISGAALHPQEFRRIWDATLAGGWRGELLNHRKDGSTFPVFLETGVLRDEGGRPILLFGVGRDIREQRAFQERLLLEAKLGTLGVLCHSLSHEIRNRLTAIKMGLYQLAQPGVPAGQAREHFAIVREEVDRIELFLRSMDDTVHPPRPYFEETDLLEAVNRGLEQARPILLQKSISLRRQFPDHPPRLVLDRDQFSRAVAQLAQNASEAMDPGGEIHVVVKRQPERERTWWLVEVRDNGPGVPPTLRSRVFEPFFTTEPQRLGLGLSNVHRVVTLHGGGVELTSLPGGGTTVTLRLPADDGEV
jgi:PAS domain S-box-containing protein